MASKKSKNKYYSKRPLWQWILLYLVVGGIIYFALYYAGILNFGGYSSKSPSYQYNSK